MRRPAVVLVGVALAGTLMTPDAHAQWSATTTIGSAGSSAALTLGAGNTPIATVPAASMNVTVSWSAQSTGAPAAGYEVRVYDATSGASRAIAAGCAGLVTATSCVESAVPQGAWRYSVTPRRLSWAGAESPRSDPVVVQ